MVYQYLWWIVGLVGVSIVAWYLYRSWQRQKLLRSGIEEIDRMHWREFEIYLGALFTEHGYSAKVTQGSGDFGADVVLTEKGRRIVVQAKHYSRNVGIKAVQEINAAKDYYKAAEAWVVTNQDFTPQAYRLASATGVRLINRDELIKFIIKAQKRKKSVERGICLTKKP